MAQCPYCGKNNPTSAGACAYCGSPMGSGDDDYTNDYTGYDDDGGYGSGESPAPGKTEKKKKAKSSSFNPSVLLAAAGGLLGIGLIVGLVVLLTSALNPMAPVTRAMNKTMDAFQQQTGALEELEDFAATFASVQDARKTYSSTTLGVNLVGTDSVYLNLDCFRDAKEELASGALSFGMENHGEFSKEYSLSSTRANVAVPQLLRNTMFQFTYDDLAAALNKDGTSTLSGKDLNPFLLARQAEGPLLEDAGKAVKAALKDFIGSVELLEQAPTSVAGRIWTPYILSFPEQEQEVLVLAVDRYMDAMAAVYPAELLDLLAGGHSWDAYTAYVTGQLRIYDDFRVCVDDRGYLVSLSFSDGIFTTELSLEGEDNPWESFYVYQDEQVLFRGNVLADEETVTITCIDNDTDSIRLTYNDTTGDYSLQLMDVLTLEGYVRNFRGGVEFSAKLDLTVAQVWLTCLTQKTGDEPVELAMEKVYNPLNSLGGELLKSLWNDTDLAQELKDGLDGLVESVKGALFLESP